MSGSLSVFAVLSLAFLGQLIRPKYEEFVPEVTLVVPEGWSGVILVERVSILIDPADIPSKVVIHVPANGIVSKSESGVFFGDFWKRVSIMSGSKILPMQGEDENLLDNVIAFRDTAVSDDRGMWMVVGTRADWESFLVGKREPGPKREIGQK